MYAERRVCGHRCVVTGKLLKRGCVCIVVVGFLHGRFSKSRVRRPRSPLSEIASCAPYPVLATPAVHAVILSFEVVPEDRNHDRFRFGRLLCFRQRVSVRGRVHGVITVRSAPEDQQPLKGQYIGYCSRYLYLQLSFYASDNR